MNEFYSNAHESGPINLFSHQKEENVLAQEAVLEALLRSEEQHSQWPLWDKEDQQGVVRKAYCWSNQGCQGSNQGTMIIRGSSSVTLVYILQIELINLDHPPPLPFV